MPARYNALPAARSKAPVLRIRLYAVLAALLLASAAGIVSAGAWLNVKPTPQTPSPSSVTESSTVATNYLLGQSTVVPVAAPSANTSGAQWDLDQTLGIQPGVGVGHRELYSLSLDRSGAHSYGFIISTYGIAPNATYVETDFYVAVTNYGTFVVAVPMYLTATGPELAALPSLSPYEPAGSTNAGGLDYHNYTGFEAPTPAMATAVTQWAQAYVTGSPSLTSVVAPPTPNAGYTSISGFALDSAVAIGAVPGTLTDAAYTYVRARLVMHSTRANGVTLTMDYDLMLTTATSGTAYNVVAWGPTGSAAALVPYQSNLASS